MAKTAKRLLIVALTVLLVVVFGVAGVVMAAQTEDEPICYLQGDVSPDGSVTKNDAIYLLYASISSFAEDYPLNQDGDFQKDGILNKDDAIYLLYASIPAFAEDYPLAGTVHMYHSPTWNWDEENQTASVTFKCGCGQEHTQNATVQSQIKATATCTAAGSVELSAAVQFEGQEYTAIKTVVIPASGQHQMVGTQDCENGSYCNLCDYELSATGHKWEKIGSIAATCTSHAVETYQCTTCQQTKDVELEGELGHTYVQEAQDVQLSECQFAKQFSCKDCGTKKDIAEEDKYDRHSYTAQLTKEVTCTQPGEKTYTCTCGDSYKETLQPDGVSHIWVVASEDGSTINYACSQNGCNETKTTVKASDDGKVSTDALTEDVGVELKDNTSVSMDKETLEDLDDREIQISVETKPVDELDLPAERKEQIGDNPVYDFTMVYTDTNEPISNFAGTITVTLPYDLGDDDIDSIDVWFINDQGEVESKEGTYSNGFVTFTTTHFSYYTVTRLTAEERCARYGHILTTSSRVATCTSDGYSMKVCQRCGETFEKVEYPASGHDYKETTVAATCGKAGQVTKKCENCTHTVIGLIPALAHDMVVDEKLSVAATCSAAGKTVSVCARPGCGHTAEEAIAQLSHNYVPTESVKATCTAGGYDLYKCTLCGDEQIKNETAPKGHLYLEKDAVWNWTEDLSGATVTLVCANDETHTKELTAVVTLDTKLSGAPTCTNSGISVYSAAASFNNVTYTKYNKAEAPALGHQPNGKLQSNASSHYYICNVCGEKVDAASHEWNAGTVTVAPTCGESGKKVVSCTVCGYEKEMKVPATGEHTYVDGVCSVCGFDGNACNHNKVTRKELDPADYGICEGSQIYLYSCECGENQYLDYDRLACNIDEPKQEKVPNEAGGYDYYLYGSCSECSLSVCQKQITTLVEGECASRLVVTMEIYIGDELLGVAPFHEETRPHPGVTTVEKVDLGEFGLCGGIVEVKQCPCGEYSKTVITDGKCQWEYQGIVGDYTEGYYCSVCGANRDTTYTPATKNGCYNIEQVVESYINAKGNFVCRTVSTYVYEAHSYEVVDYEMYGESCTDGVLLKVVCTECGVEDERYIEYHEKVLEDTVYDMTGKDVCFDKLIVESCLCQEKWTSIYMTSEEGNYCQWRGYVDENGNESRECMKCGTQATIETVYGEKDENCRVTVRRIYTYCYSNGELLAVVAEVTDETRHTMKTEGILLGETCQDGVIIREYCVDCGYEWESEYTWHYEMVLETYDLSDWDVCFTELTLHGCACGENVRIETHGGWCNWEHVAGVPNGWVQMCMSCGLTREYRETYSEGKDACHPICHITYTYTMEGKEPMVISYEIVAQNHDVERSFKLQEGATSCVDGVEITEICRNCGYTDTWTTHYHETFETVQENVDGGKLCGSVDLIISSCACGLGSDTSLRWTGEDRCSFSGSYNEEEKCWIFTCYKCGAYYKEISETVRNEEEPCRYDESHQFTYYAADGTELFSYASEGWYTSHAYIYTYKLIGETCDDGYYMTRYCQRCGMTNEWTEPYYGCETRAVERDVLHNGDGICGEIELLKYACACGAEVRYEVDYSCSFSWGGWNEELGGEVYECRVCGLQRVYNSEDQRTPGSCRVNRTIYYTFLLDGEVLCSVEKTYEQTSHLTVTVKNLLGETCEDGWTLTQKCLYCDYTWENEYVDYGHTNYRLMVYDLAQYGMCGGLMELYGCGCGEEEWMNNNGIRCSWQHMGDVDDADGNIYYCEGCGTYKTEIYTSQINKAECRIYRSTSVTYTREGETVLEYSINYYDGYHEYLYIGGSLNGATCEDGFTAYLQCAACGETETYGGQYHDTFVTEYIDMTELGSSCGGKLGIATCVCGLRKELTRWDECNGWNWQYLEDTGDSRNGSDKEKAWCNSCGIEVIYERTWTTAEDSCTTYTTGTATVTLGEYTKVVPLAQVGENHMFIEEVYTLAPGSVTCNDGVIVSRTCALCGETETWHTSGHATMVVDRFDMSAMGAECGGYIRIFECACGENKNWNIEETSCNWSWWTELDEGDYRNGSSRMRYECNDCSFAMLIETQWTTPDDSCRTESTVRVYAEDGNGEEFTFRRYYTSHLLETYCELKPGSVTCEDGVLGTDRCTLCDYYQTWHSYDHSQMVVDRIDVGAMGSPCGGAIRILNCACGANPGWNTQELNCYWDYGSNISSSGDSRNGKRLDKFECENCDMVLFEETTFTTPDDSCQTLAESLITVQVGEYAQSFTNSWYNTNHIWVRSAVLRPGSQNCNDGIIVTDTCTICGESNSWESSGHMTTELQRIDLTPYGSVCGAQLVVEGCACGYSVSAGFSDETKCDMDDQWTEPWIEGAIDYIYQPTADGWNSISSNFYTYTCAVTDPACGLRLRQAYYWLAEGCIATHYIQWQAWDEASQSWITLIDIESGNQRAVHNYTNTNGVDTLEDGTEYRYQHRDCPDCGSYYYSDYTYFADGGYKYVEDAKNTLSIGNRKELHVEEIHEIVLDGHSRETYYYQSYVDMDGTSEWWRYTYDYQYDQGECKYIYTYESSNGDYETHEEEAHITSSSHEVVKDATCTQMGARYWTEKCLICDKVTYEYLDEYGPNDHYWYWDQQKQTYVCTHEGCGLENANGASGSIVMEDMTDTHGNGENYVIGYWNRGDIEFMPTISVILDNAQEGYNELYLEGIQFGYQNKVEGDVNTITAVTFNAATVEAMAAQAVSDAGYTGSYAIRISFVPVNGADDLDYAITFDSVTAE